MRFKDFAEQFPIEVKDFPLVAENENGEKVLVNYGEDENGEYYTTDTVQKNGWIRVNYYYKEGSITEMYKK